MTKIRGKSRKYTDPAYYEANRIECGLNHQDYGKFTYSHISKERWEEIFGSHVHKEGASLPKAEG